MAVQRAREADEYNPALVCAGARLDSHGVVQAYANNGAFAATLLHALGSATMSTWLPFEPGALLARLAFWVDQRTDQPGNQMLINIVPTTMRTTLKKSSSCHYDGDGDSGTDDDSMAFRNELVALLYEHVSLTSQ